MCIVSSVVWELYSIGTLINTDSKMQRGFASGRYNVAIQVLCNFIPIFGKIILDCIGHKTLRHKFRFVA